MNLHRKADLVMAALALVLAIFFVLWARGCKHKLMDSPQPTQTIKANEEAVVTYNDDTHVLTTVTHGGVKKQYADDPVIHIEDDGDVVAETHPVGRRFTPFVGFSYGDGPRLNVGVSVYHFWRVDTNLHLAFTLDDAKGKKAVVILGSLSYNVYSNTSLFVGIDPIGIVTSQKPSIHGGILLKF